MLNALAPRVKAFLGAALSLAGRSSRTYVHNRPVLVLPWPGGNTGTGVTSACSFAESVERPVQNFDRRHQLL